MKLAVVLSNNYLLALTFFFAWVDEISTCDTKWIRFVYMMSCGKKKRESIWSRNDTFYENLPRDFEGALKYFKDRDPSNPIFSNDAWWHELLEDEDETTPMKYYVPKLMLDDTEPPSSTTTLRRPSILIQKLFRKSDSKSRIGIPGFPDQWDLREIIEDKINENHRREINRLIEECCKIPPVTTCNGNTFSGACK